MKDYDKCDSNFIFDPRNYNLTEDFIFIDQEWGSMFYKYIGKMEKEMAKQICSNYGDSVHLPVPRFLEEKTFYQTHFGETSLWLDIIYNADTGFQSSSGHSFTERVHTVSSGILKFNKYEWMNTSTLNISGSHNVIMTPEGQWSTVDEQDTFDSVCVYNVMPNQKCSNCADKDFCRFTDRYKQKTECVCSKNMEGKLCKNNTCKHHCHNRGFCQLNDLTLEFDCICRYPFQGKKCETSKKFLLVSASYFILEASQYNLPNEFVYIEKPWGSLFYKLLGQRTKLQAKQECSKNVNTSLPIPRSLEEIEFYRTQFGNKRLWLDISKNNNSYLDSSNNRIFSSIIQTNAGVIQVDQFDWINFNLTQKKAKEVIMLENGHFDAVNEEALNEAVCVYNIVSEENCTRCSRESFCRYKNSANNKTECACPMSKRGDTCEIDLCSECQNGGICRIEDKTNAIECICPRPFDGINCEVNLCPHCLNGGHCEVSDGQKESDCICPSTYTGKYCEKKG